MLIFPYLTILLFLKQTFQRGPIYMCSDDKFLDNQCLDERRIASNQIYFLRKCPLNQACQILTKSETNNSIGLCVPRKHHSYEQNKCRKNYECSSGICQNNQCVGLSEGRSCDPNRYQCKFGYICRKNNSESNLYTCQHPIEEGKECLESNDCIISHICSKTNNNTIKTCIRIGSLEIGSFTSHSMACQSGDSYNNICIRRIQTSICDNNNKCNVKIQVNQNGSEEKINENCFFSSKGAGVCPSNLIEKYFNDYIKEFYEGFKGKIIGDIEHNDFNVEKYKYTLDKERVIEAYFNYKYWYFIGDADECALQYFFLINSQKWIFFNWKILVILFLMIF